MLTGPSDALEPGAVRGIAQLTASSVKGLKTENVTITDGSGQLLWPQGDAGGAGGGAPAPPSRPPQTRYERQLQASLDALLAQTLGPGKARVQVKADLNVDQTTREQLTIDGKPVPSKETTETEKLKGGSAPSPAAPRAPARNIPTYSQPGAGGDGELELQPQEQDRRERGPQDGREDRRSRPARSTSLQVALVVDKTVPPADFAAIQTAVKGAAGHRRQARRRLRGDAARVRQAARRAEGRPGAGRHARPAEVGRPRPRARCCSCSSCPAACASARARRSPRRAG